MKVKIYGIEKIIPKRCKDGVKLMRDVDIEDKDRKRLTKNERFFLEFFTWMHKLKSQQPLIFEHLDGLTPARVVIQKNRNRDTRYVVVMNDNSAHAVVGSRIMNASPIVDNVFFDFE